jgi:hypothetical protein
MLQKVSGIVLMEYKIVVLIQQITSFTINYFFVVVYANFSLVREKKMNIQNVL